MSIAMSENVKVIDRGWSKILKAIGKLEKGRASSVGFQGNEAELQAPDHGDMTNVELGAIHEFGTTDGRIPERPMIRATFDKKQKEYETEMKRINKKVTAGESVEDDLLLLGEQFRGDIIEAIKGNEFEDWADSTKAQKEREGREGGVPLWVTGQLMNALTAVVVDAGSKK
jgi:phage gpG-like protein